MFVYIFLLYSWLPPPLDILVAGAFGLFLLLALIRLITAIIDMIPFL